MMYAATGARARLISLFVGTIGGGLTQAKCRRRFRICFAVEENIVFLLRGQKFGVTFYSLFRQSG